MFGARFEYLAGLYLNCSKKKYDGSLEKMDKLFAQLTGGRRANAQRKNKSRKNRGLVEAVYNPLERVVKGAENVFGSAANTAYAVPATLAKGAKNTVKSSVIRLTKGIRNVGRKGAKALDSAATSAFTGKSSRKMRSSRNSRNSRKESRKNRKASRKASRKNRKASRKNNRK